MHLADRPSKRAKNVGLQGPSLSEIDAITPRLTKQKANVNKKGFSYETYVKNRSFMETLQQRHTDKYIKRFEGLQRYIAMLEFKLKAALAIPKPDLATR